MTRTEAVALGRQAMEWIVVLSVAGAAAFLIRSFVVQRFFISGPSMEPTMYDGDQILVLKLAYRFGSPDRGDVVVFDRITTDGAIVQHDDLIKRVVATEGEVVEIRGCTVIVDGRPVDEPYLEPDGPDDPAERCRMPDMAPVTVPEGDLFVMGDNRSESFDSRMFGPVDSHQVVGKAVAVIWPLDDAARL